MPAKKKVNTFEKNLQNLEVIVEKMENSSLSLDESLAAFEEGVKLVKSCQKELKTAEQKIHILSEENGEYTTRSFNQKDNAE
ncbi:MAG: exodeoxyribonuclease VII small subunit [Endozoicomonadaceae bacterium]|nr:exodeoxyribonuclease VII small subunit [Endozoicomonadaceae bacterium]MCY4330426.1 exodeoxyribonuclease VII small subunit [Endozoicomonadaceae bacterium]